MGNSLLGNAYVNPNMPPEVAKLLAEMGFAPDGSRMDAGVGSAFGGLSTQQRLDALNGRISADWQNMGFNPPPPASEPPPEENIFVGANSGFADTGQDPFGQETRAKLGALNQRIDSDIAAMEAPQPSMQQRGDISGMSYTPPMPAPMPAPPVPRPTPRPRPTAYIVKKGDNPTKIARMMGMTLQELEAKNPGIIKRARKLRPGQSVNL
jgi:hypothetical protein